MLCWHLRSVRFFTCAVFLVGALLMAQESEQSSAASEKSSPMARLRSAFDQAKPANTQDLAGTWVAVKEIWTEKFLKGRAGPDRIETDENGIRAATSGQSAVGRPGVTISGHPFEWKLTFRNVGGRLRAISDVPWKPTGDISDVSFNTGGEFTLAKDYGGDAAWVYRCHAADSRRLVCLLKAREGHGVEFRRVDDEPSGR